MNKLIYIVTCACTIGFSSCADLFLDLEPLDTKTDVVYFQTPEHFREYATGLYGQLAGWSTAFDNMDISSDLSTYFANNSDIGTGTISVVANNGTWDNCYANIRAVNMLFLKAESYSGNKEELKQSLGEGHFFRAYAYYNLLKTFGGVPLITGVLDVNSPELYAARDSRYKIVDYILADLQDAIEMLPSEQSLSSDDKGRITSGGAKAFKARVLLYEATWRKYNGTSTDFEGSEGPVSDQINDFLEDAISLCQEVINDGAYQIWNYNNIPEMENMSSRYLFNIEDETSNDAGKGKDSNKEFIIYSVYDKNLRPGSIELNQGIWKVTPSRKFIDMFLCSNGLPIMGNPQFKGYEHPGDEFDNRDYRLKSYIGRPASNATLIGGQAGYTSYKFAITKRNPSNKDEHANYPILRLAEVYLNYTEAVYERYGQVKDEELKYLNILRDRAGVEHLTNALVLNNGLDMLTEIRRERTVELYMEGFRYDDLKRWAKLEEALNSSRCGMVVGDVDYKTDFIDDNGNAVIGRYDPQSYVWGTERVETGAGPQMCVVLNSKINMSATKSDYLWPIPSRQIELNPNLKQNPGY